VDILHFECATITFLHPFPVFSDLLPRANQLHQIGALYTQIYRLLSYTSSDMPQLQIHRDFPLIDSDPHFARVVRYFRPSDYATWGLATAAGPTALYLFGRSLSYGLEVEGGLEADECRKGRPYEIQIWNQAGITSNWFPRILRRVHASISTIFMYVHPPIL
jgi:hypothetical protein